MTERIPTPDELNAMTPTEHKVFENRLRRASARQGLTLVKSRTRDPRAIGYGTYLLADENNCVAVGPGLGLDEVARALFE